MSQPVRLHRVRKSDADRFIATRNGVPCSFEKVSVRAPGFNFNGRVLFALPLPPSDPHVFRSSATADRAVERSKFLTQKIRGSLIRGFVLEKFPTLQAFDVVATFATQLRKSKK